MLSLLPTRNVLPFRSPRSPNRFAFQSLAASCAAPKKSTPLESDKSSLFLQNTRGGGTPTLPRKASLPPSYAPRGASIPCGLTRLRILPVTTGVYHFLFFAPFNLQ